MEDFMLPLDYNNLVDISDGSVRPLVDPVKSFVNWISLPQLVVILNLLTLLMTSFYSFLLMIFISFDTHVTVDDH